MHKSSNKTSLDLTYKNGKLAQATFKIKYDESGIQKNQQSNLS